MITPNLKEVFFKQDFIDDEMPETKAAETKIKDTLTKIGTEYGLTFDDYCELEENIGGMATVFHYLGFLQGFKWAVYLFTGHRDESTDE